MTCDTIELNNANYCMICLFYLIWIHYIIVCDTANKHQGLSPTYAGGQKSYFATCWFVIYDSSPLDLAPKITSLMTTKGVLAKVTKYITATIIKYLDTVNETKQMFLPRTG